MANNIPQITDAESAVMRVLWEKGDSTSQQIIAEVSKDSDWKPKTIQTLITRLVSKKAISVIKINPKAFLYSPLFTKEQYENDANQTFLQKMYNGSLSLLLARFVKEQNLSKEEIDELKSILEENKQ